MPPIHKRPYAAFLSHAHADKAAVDRIAHWLLDVAGVAVWYDSWNLPASTPIVTHLPKAIGDCRALILVLSRSSTSSPWVQEEYSVGISQRVSQRQFRIVPLRIEECPVPGFLATTKWIDAPDGKLSVEAAFDLLLALHFDETDRDPDTSRDVYVARTWRDHERRLADLVCQQMAEGGFRLIGDAQDQAHFPRSERDPFWRAAGPSWESCLIAARDARRLISSESSPWHERWGCPP